jgi:hypothetical protein
MDWAVTINGFTRGAEANQAIAATNRFNDPAPTGWQYLLATITVTNISTDQEAKGARLGIDLRVTGEHNVLYSRAGVVVPQPLEGDLFPDGSATGQVAFLVPSDESNLMFFVDERFDLDSETHRFVALDAGATVSPDPALRTITPTDLGNTRAAPAAFGSMTISPGWEVTLLEVIGGEASAQAIAEANRFNDPAPAGEAYVLVRIRIRYLGGGAPDQVAEISRRNFKATGIANVIYPRASVVVPEPELDAYLYPGGQSEGWIVVQVPTGEAGLTLIYEPSFEFGNENRRFLSLE